MHSVLIRLILSESVKSISEKISLLQFFTKCIDRQIGKVKGRRIDLSDIP